MFCLQIHPRAYRTMNEIFPILREAELSAVLKISSSLYGKQVRVFVNKTRTCLVRVLSLILLIFNLSSLRTMVLQLLRILDRT